VGRDQPIPVAHLHVVATFEALHAEVKQEVMVVAEETNDLVLTHVQCHHQALHDELRRRQSLIQKLWHVKVAIGKGATPSEHSSVTGAN